MFWNPDPNRQHQASINALTADVSQIKHALTLILHQENKLMNILDTLTADVDALTVAVKQAVTLLQELRSQIIGAGVDPVALAAIAAKIESDTAALVAGLAPPAPPVTPPVTPPVEPPVTPPITPAA
jgi:hypothetical protein